MSHPAEPAGAFTRFYDVRGGREMLLQHDGPWAGWLFVRHPEGHWVSLRKASDADLDAVARASANAAPGPARMWFGGGDA